MSRAVSLAATEKFLRPSIVNRTTFTISILRIYIVINVNDYVEHRAEVLKGVQNWQAVL